jgi:anaerobic selenocysteine-containing dehydrogenase
MNSTLTAFALSILNILAGNIDRRGGRYFARTVSIPSDTTIFPPPTDFPPATGRRVGGRVRLPLAHPFNQGMFATLAGGILNTYPGMIKCALLEADGALAFPQPLQFLEALSTIDFVVYGVLPNDTVNYADIVLPGATYLESSGLVSRNFRAPYPEVTVRQPRVPAMYETRSAGFLGAELGGAWRSTISVPPTDRGSPKPPCSNSKSSKPASPAPWRSSAPKASLNVPPPSRPAPPLTCPATSATSMSPV